MIPTDLIKSIQDAGIAVFLALALVWMVWFLIRHTVVKLGQIMDKIVDKIEAHDKAAAERGRFIREEHRQMIETLGRINGYKK